MDAHSLIGWSPGVTLDAIEKQTILIAFRFYRGNKTATANSLGIAIRTLDNKLERYQEDAKSVEERKENDKRKREEFLARSRGTPFDNVYRGAPAKEVESARVTDTSPGVRMEPTQNTPSQSSMPVSQREKVQVVLPRPATGGGARKSS